MSNIRMRLTMFTVVAVSTALAGLILMLTSSPTSAFILEPKGQSKSNDIKTSKGPVYTASSSLSSSDTSSSSVSKRSLSSSSNDPSVRHHENSILSGVWSPSGMWGFLPSSKKVVAAPPPSLHSQSSPSIPSSFHKKSLSSSENSSTKKKAVPGDLFLDPVTLDEKSAFRHRNPIITNANSAGSTVGAGSSHSSSLFHSESAPPSAGGSSNAHHPTPPPRPQYRLSPPKRLEPPLGNDIDNRILADDELMEILEEDAEPRDLLAHHNNDQHSSWATHLKRSSPAVVTRSFSDFNEQMRHYDIPQIVAECKNIKSTGSKLVFHRFPTYDKDRCKSWELKCKRKDHINVANARICSDHFSDDSYERDLKNELLGLPLRKQLKKSAVPSLFPERCLTPPNDRCMRSEKRNNRKIIDALLHIPVLESGDDERQDLDVTNNPTSESSETENLPQLTECPPADDGMERFACPSADHIGRYRCVDDHVLCDGFVDCPGKEDEDLQACMFYKTTKAHLDVLADALLRWARGKR